MRTKVAGSTTTRKTSYRLKRLMIAMAAPSARLTYLVKHNAPTKSCTLLDLCVSSSNSEGKNNVLSVQEGQVGPEIFSARHHYLWKDWIEDGPFMNVSFTSGGILSSMTTLALSMDSRTSASKYYSFDRSNAGDVVARLDSSASSIALRADSTNTEELRFWRIKNGEISGASSFYD